MHFGEFGVLPVSKNSTCQVTSCVTQPSAMAAFTAALVEAELQVSLTEHGAVQTLIKPNLWMKRPVYF